MGLTIVGLVLNVALAIYNFFSNEKIKKLILKEKDMIRNKIIDISTNHQAEINKVLNDRETYHDPTRNTVETRIEYLQADVENLNRFAKELEKIG